MSALEFYSEITSELRKNSKSAPRNFNLPKYLGNNHPSLNVPTPVKRTIAKSFVKKYGNIARKDFEQLLLHLAKAEYFDQKTIAGTLLEYGVAFRKNFPPRLLDELLNHLEGWAEVDSLCQSNFPASEMLEKWGEWKPLLKKLSKNSNTNKRRASLVLLVKPVSQSSDKKLSKLAFGFIKKLQNEKDLGITKAVSWLLRNLIVNHKTDVSRYIKENSDYLPKIVLRETLRKLSTGKK